MALTQNYSLRLDADQRSKLEEIARRQDRDAVLRDQEGHR